MTGLPEPLCPRPEVPRHKGQVPAFISTAPPALPSSVLCRPRPRTVDSLPDRIPPSICGMSPGCMLTALGNQCGGGEALPPKPQRRLCPPGRGAGWKPRRQSKEHFPSSARVPASLYDDTACGQVTVASTETAPGHSTVQQLWPGRPAAGTS